MANESELINITVCHSLGARQVVETTHSVPAGITVAQWRTGHDEPTPQAVLALWGRHGVIERQFDALGAWRAVATDVRGGSLDCGHYIPEEAPDALLEALVPFLQEHRP